LKYGARGNMKDKGRKKDKVKIEVKDEKTKTT